MRLIRTEELWVGDREVSDDEVILVTTRNELVTLAGAINEALEAVEEWEFDTRLGVTREQARTLRSQIGEVLRATFRAE